MKFAVKLSILVAASVCVLGVYTVTARADVPAPAAQQAPQRVSSEKSSGLLSEPSTAAGLGRPDFSPETSAAPILPDVSALPGVPVHLSIPAAGIEAPVVRVGTTAGGDMAVPSGTTNNVGWYERGTLPGNAGSAVLDAHVFAALKNLHKAEVGDDIYIETATGRLHFVVEEVVTHALADVPRQKLFNRADRSRLNLITCAGTYSAESGTYDHRLVVYAVLAA